MIFSDYQYSFRIQKIVALFSALLADCRRVALWLWQAYYFAGLFLIHTQKYDKAREYIDRAYKLNSHAKDVSDKSVHLNCRNSNYIIEMGKSPYCWGSVVFGFY